MRIPGQIATPFRLKSPPCSDPNRYPNGNILDGDALLEVLMRDYIDEILGDTDLHLEHIEIIRKAIDELGLQKITGIEHIIIALKHMKDSGSSEEEIQELVDWYKGFYADIKDNHK